MTSTSAKIQVIVLLQILAALPCMTVSQHAEYLMRERERSNGQDEASVNRPAEFAHATHDQLAPVHHHAAPHHFGAQHRERHSLLEAGISVSTSGQMVRAGIEDQNTDVVVGTYREKTGIVIGANTQEGLRQAIEQAMIQGELLMKVGAAGISAHERKEAFRIYCNWWFWSSNATAMANATNATNAITAAPVAVATVAPVAAAAAAAPAAVASTTTPASEDPIAPVLPGASSIVTGAPPVTPTLAPTAVPAAAVTAAAPTAALPATAAPATAVPAAAAPAAAAQADDFFSEGRQDEPPFQFAQGSKLHKSWVPLENFVGMSDTAAPVPAAATAAPVAAAAPVAPVAATAAPVAAAAPVAPVAAAAAPAAPVAATAATAASPSVGTAIGAAAATTTDTGEGGSGMGAIFLVLLLIGVISALIALIMKWRARSANTRIGGVANLSGNDALIFKNTKARQSFSRSARLTQSLSAHEVSDSDEASPAAASRSISSYRDRRSVVKTGQLSKGESSMSTAKSEPASGKQRSASNASTASAAAAMRGGDVSDDQDQHSSKDSEATMSSSRTTSSYRQKRATQKLTRAATGDLPDAATFPASLKKTVSLKDPDVEQV